LAKVLHVSRARLEKEFSQRDSWYAIVARQVDPALAKKALALKIPGVGSSPEEKRFYPLNTLAAQILGCTDIDNKGIAGLELTYNDELEGKPGSERVVCDPTGQVLRIDDERDPQPGSTVRLTLDQDIQFKTEQVLLSTVREYHAKDATGIVMDPRTGAILAMANVPLVNANKWGSTPAALERNRAVTDIYEPGSTFKLVTVSAALQEGLVTPDTSFVLPPSLTVSTNPLQVIHDAEKRGTERMTVSQILARSSNIGAATLGKMLGRQKLSFWIKRFGFGQPTGIAFPGEASGLVPQHWWQSTIATVPMGQGISVTALQMAAAYAAIANGGVWQQPRLVAQVGDKVVPPTGQRRIVSAKVAREVLSMMRDVVIEGTGTAFQIPNYTVAGKTGTAQVPYYNKPGYMPGAYVSSFIGVVPARSPRLLVMVVVDRPSNGAYYGAVVSEDRTLTDGERPRGREEAFW
jgi:cell division protein FtsI/penicillin-binding protein 2